MNKKDVFCKHGLHINIPCLICRNFRLLEAAKKREREGRKVAVKRVVERAKNFDWD